MHVPRYAKVVMLSHHTPASILFLALLENNGKIL
nr:MAG TPA: hypothetical protein [Bacteriophage sp.]